MTTILSLNSWESPKAYVFFRIADTLVDFSKKSAKRNLPDSASCSAFSLSIKFALKEGGKEKTGETRFASHFLLPIVPCASSPVTRVLLAFRALLCEKQSAWGGGNREFKQRRFWATHVNRKWSIFPFNTPWRYQIWSNHAPRLQKGHFRFRCVAKKTLLLLLPNDYEQTSIPYGPPPPPPLT